MNIKNPTVTIRNTDSSVWMVDVEGLVSTSDQESVTFTVALPRSDQGLPTLTRLAAERAVQLLQLYLNQPIG